MNIREVCITGKTYAYAYADLYVNRGKRIRKNKSLGPIDSQSKSIKLEEFINQMQKDEADERNMYWSKKINDPKFTKYSPISKIENARSELFWSAEKIGQLAHDKIETEFQIEFIVNSNQIEGSKVPASIVKEQILNPRRRIDDETINTVKAIYFSKEDFSFDSRLQISKLHKTLLKHEPQYWGFRREEIIVANSEVTDWKEIGNELLKLLKLYSQKKWTEYPPKLAFDFYYQLERIHPFSDGNGRTGRLIMNRILQDHKYHPMIVWNSNREAHLNAFEKRMAGRSQDYYKFMSEQLLMSYDFFSKKIDN